MITQTFSALAAATVLLAAAPALAGPAGSGLAFTESQAARKATEQRTVKVAVTEHACADNARAALAGHADVARVLHRDGHVHVVFRSRAGAAQHAADVRNTVARTCS